MFQNIPEVKLGIVAVSRDCFPIDLSQERRAAVVKAYEALGGSIVECKTTIENENDTMKALDELKANGCNALVVFLGNFGPEGPETMLAEKFEGPSMFMAAAEENIGVLSSRRGDAYCGMLSMSVNMKLRGITPYIPEYPVGTAEDCAKMIADFVPVARTLIGLKKLKVITFGPRPYDFLACNAPIAPLFKLGVNIQENSELDLLAAYNAHKDDPRIPGVIEDMAKELGAGNKMPGILPRLAQYEITLLDWIEENKGAAEYVVLANKCWPAFQTQFGFVPCYVNSRFTSRGIPIACEVDIWGAVSEYIGTCVSGECVTLLDINNSVPADMYKKSIEGKFDYRHNELFMGFHCGNTPICRLCEGTMKYQLIMNRGLEGGGKPVISRGTMEGQIKPSDTTMFRLQSNSEGHLVSYIAHGQFLDVNPHSFGSIGVAAIPGFARFYRHVLVAKRFPHHGAFGFEKVGKVMFESLKLLGVDDINTPLPAGQLYAGENPFAL